MDVNHTIVSDNYGTYRVLDNLVYVQNTTINHWNLKTILSGAKKTGKVI